MMDERWPDNKCPYFMQYRCTLFTESDRGDFFYGRTYQSDRRPLKLDRKDASGIMLKHDSSEEFIYMHTSYVDPRVKMVIELVLIYKIGDQILYASGGFSLLDIFGNSKQGHSTVVSGSPRQILFARSNKQ